MENHLTFISSKTTSEEGKSIHLLFGCRCLIIGSFPGNPRGVQCGNDIDIGTSNYNNNSRSIQTYYCIYIMCSYKLEPPLFRSTRVHFLFLMWFCFVFSGLLLVCLFLIFCPSSIYNFSSCFRVLLIIAEIVIRKDLHSSLSILSKCLGHWEKWTRPLHKTLVHINFILWWIIDVYVLLSIKPYILLYI